MQSSPDDKNIFALTACIPAAQLLAYSKQSLAGKEFRLVEEHLADCELCSSALEGFLAGAVTAADLLVLSKKVSAATGHGFFTALSTKIIAGIVVLSLSAGGLWLMNRPPAPEKQIVPAPAPVASFTSVQDSVPATCLENKEPLPQEKNEVKNFSPREKFIQIPLPTVDVPQQLSNTAANTASNSVPVYDNNSASLNSNSVPKSWSNSALPIQQNTLPGIADNNSILRNTSSGKENSALTLNPAEVVTPSYNRPMCFIYNLKVSDYNQFYRMSGQTASNLLNRGTPSNLEDRHSSDPGDPQLETVRVQSADLVLRDGLLYFSNGNYEKALGKFNSLLGVNAKDVNALFYSGLCYYNLKLADRCIKQLDLLLLADNNAFQEEGIWYKAQAQWMKADKIGTRETLKKIVDGKGFYAQQAKEKLKEIK
ncbi:MAG TPA: hypothetical protein VNZ86_18625 [Bacteroidia bacterium]|jgi:hypothetical protein|nr:hypothetical protein [Bacteroidia bacterium]